MKIKVLGKIVEIKKSTRKNKQKMAILPNGKKIHFGDPNMREFKGTKRGDRYCARSKGISKKYNTSKDLESPNFWSRWFLWNCKNKKSYKKRPRLK